MSRIPIRFVPAATLLLLLLGVPAPAAFGAAATLNQPAQPVLWSNTVTSGGGPTGAVAECAPGCDQFDVTVALPPGVWNQKPGSLQIAIRWSGRTLGDNLRLYVYREGALIARSDGIIAIAQSVMIPNAPDGLYQVYVAYDPDSPTATVAYDGLAEVEYAVNPQPARRLLPDLEVRPHQNLSFDPSGIFFDTISPAYPSCYQSEVDEEGARLCLRFDQIFANVGEGPMELHFAVPTGETPPTSPVFQRIHRSDGSAEDLLAGAVEFHAAHGHYHFTSFGLTRLWSVDGSGTKIGSHPVRERDFARRIGGQVARDGRKVSFCLADITIDFWGQKGDGARTFNAPDCLFPAASDGTSDFFVQGITNGWADVYDWYLPDQYIDVNGLAEGLYLLESVADPDGLMVEANDANNCGSVLLRLSNMTAPIPTVERLGVGPSCK
jgi:hypothetical protein